MGGKSSGRAGRSAPGVGAGEWGCSRAGGWDVVRGCHEGVVEAEGGWERGGVVAGGGVELSGKGGEPVVAVCGWDGREERHRTWAAGNGRGRGLCRARRWGCPRRGSGRDGARRGVQRPLREGMAGLGLLLSLEQLWRRESTQNRAREVLKFVWGL